MSYYSNTTKTISTSTKLAETKTTATANSAVTSQIVGLSDWTITEAGDGSLVFASAGVTKFVISSTGAVSAAALVTPSVVF